jgi:hypothetical protein
MEDNQDSQWCQFSSRKWCRSAQNQRKDLYKFSSNRSICRSRQQLKATNLPQLEHQSLRTVPSQTRGRIQQERPGNQTFSKCQFFYFPTGDTTKSTGNRKEEVEEVESEIKRTFLCAEQDRDAWPSRDSIHLHCRGHVKE